MKILESVIRKYYLLLTKESDESNNKSMGIYLTKLENTADADQILISSLKQIKNLHRNPIAHPDINLTVQETINLFGITISAISYLLDSIDKITNKENN